MFLPVFLRQWFKIKGSSGNIADVTSGGRIKVEADLTTTNFPDTGVIARLGEVQDEPAAYTLLKRVKDLLGYLSDINHGIGPRAGETDEHSVNYFVREQLSKKREIKAKDITIANLTITLAGLAAGSARASAEIDNSANDYPATLVRLSIMSGTAPTAGKLYEIYLLRRNTTFGTDGWTGTDSVIALVNALLVGTIVVTASANTSFTAEIDLRDFILSPKWGIAVKNATDQALNATEGNHIKEYLYVVPEIQ